MTRLSGSLTFVSTIALCGIMSIGCSPAAPEQVESEAVVPVSAEPARVGDLRASIHATGTVTPAPGAELLVVAPESARIAEMPKAEGDRVATGDLLVRFEIPSASADVARQQAEVGRAEAQIENARAALTRARELFDRGVAARKEMEDADRDLADAQASHAQAQAALASAESAAGRATVRAPFSGVVVRRLHNPGDLVEATASDPVLRLVDVRRLEVTALIPIGDVARITIGAPAHLTSGVAATLTVTSLPTAVEQNTGSVPVRLSFVNPGPAFPIGAPVQVDIEAEEHAGVVLVPATAVVREGESTAVFVVAGDTAERRPVVVGLTDGTNTEVLSGLDAGEMVITRGHTGLPDGAAIALDAATS